MTETTVTPPFSAPISDRISKRFQSRGFSFFVMLTLIIAMSVPIFMIWGVVSNRAHYNQNAIQEVSDLWGGEIGLSGPALYLPVDHRVEDQPSIGNADYVPPRPIILLPDVAKIDVATESQIRKRGIFEVPVFSARIQTKAAFDTSTVETLLTKNELIRWDQAALIIQTPKRRSFFGPQTVEINGKSVEPAPGTQIPGVSGIHMPFKASRGVIEADIDIGFNGARTFAITPLARHTDLTMTSDWRDPSFAGAFLPTEREITDEGFTARWQVPNLALNVPQMSRNTGVLGDVTGGSTYRGDQFDHFAGTMGVRFIQPLDYYQMVERSVKYGVLFVALTFITLFVLENFSGQRVHPAQFVLIGVAECIFFLLLLSLSEQIGFGLAYLTASLATIALLSYYGATALRLGRRIWVLSGILTLLYVMLYLTLKSTDYALLSGSILAFCAVAATMVATRNETWGAQFADKPA